MRLFEIENPQYNNWVRYTPQSLKDDFIEYKKKESSKWESRAQQIGARFPLFATITDFMNALNNSPIVLIDSLQSVGNLTKNASIDSIKGMVSSYYQPRDVDRIIQGYLDNAKLPLPIILKGSKGLWIMAGNTRQSTARVLGINPKALLVDVRE